MTHADRVKQIRARIRIRNWEFRQRHLARGAWGRFRFALAGACRAYAIDDLQFAALVAEGFAPESRGTGLMPPKQLIWISEQRAKLLDHPRELQMRLDAAMLDATFIALVPFTTDSRQG